MTIAQATHFYAQDNKEYDLLNNKEFLTWLNNLINKGYSLPLEIQQMQELINNIAAWYETKYPERQLHEGTEYINFPDIKSISDVMDIRQLYYRLPHDQLCLMECGYRAKGWGMHAVYQDGKAAGFRTDIFMPIYLNKPDNAPEQRQHFLLVADSDTGQVERNYYIDKYCDGKKDINLDELLEIFQYNYSAALDSNELKECVFNHNSDLELRNFLLQLVALKLIYSKNTIPEIGYKRAKLMITEFNDQMGLGLSTEAIDRIMNTEYPNESLKQSTFKRILTKFSKEKK